MDSFISWIGGKKLLRKELLSHMPTSNNECIHSVTIEQINKICKYLNCTVGELFEYVPDK